MNRIFHIRTIDHPACPADFRSGRQWRNHPEPKSATYDEQAVFDEGVAEIGSYDPGTQNLIVVNSGEGSKLDFINISDAASPTLVAEIDMTAYGDGANSVDVANGLVAVAVAAEDVDAVGVYRFLGC